MTIAATANNLMLCASTTVIAKPNPAKLLISKPVRFKSHRMCCLASTTRNNDASAASSGDSKSAPRAMSPDILAMFNEAQKNIMELNRSRLKALDELKSAKQRISELEKQLAAARSAPPATKTTAAPEPRTAQPSPSSSQQQQVAAPPAPAPPPVPAPVDGILVVYETGWDVAFLHFNADGRGWTHVPGQKMETGQGEYSNAKVLKVDAKVLEFVLTNGNDWDSPDPSGSGRQNYRADGPGVYKLKRGKLAKM